MITSRATDREALGGRRDLPARCSSAAFACSYSFECGMKFPVHRVSLLNDHEHRYNRRYDT